MTIYQLVNGTEVIVFQSEADACAYLGVQPCSVASAYMRNRRCKGYTVRRIGDSFHRETKTWLHKIWEYMHARCEYKKHPHFGSYGGRGITVCYDWLDYVEFSKWAKENGYSDGLTIDRIDVNGDYKPENCRWVTMKEQQNNKRTNHYVEFNGETHTLSEWSDITGISKTTLRERVKAGWSAGKALSKPTRKRTRGFRPSVLQEKQEREKGCKWCMSGEHRDVVGNAHNYCPWCGRKLIGGAEHEEE